LGLLICGTLFGIPGLLIAIPLVCVLKVALQTYASVVAR
jgi:predicted PurR-regulated permease PerM